MLIFLRMASQQCQSAILHWFSFYDTRRYGLLKAPFVWEENDFRRFTLFGWTRDFIFSHSVVEFGLVLLMFYGGSADILGKTLSSLW